MGSRFFLRKNSTFPPLDKRNTRDKAKGFFMDSNLSPIKKRPSPPRKLIP